MIDILKKPYEISLWDEEFRYIITFGNIEDRYEVTSLPATGNYTVLNQYIKENKIAVIGSNTTDSPIRVFEPKFTQQTNGTNTLTFQLYHKYYDEDEDVFKINPFLDLLVNERKIKLFYDDEWYDFIIKEVQEKSENNIFSYTCKDLHINELSKNGYNLEFSTELENNQGTVTELGDKILEESEWRIDKENSEIIQQKEKEALYTCQLTKDLKSVVVADFNYKKISYKKGEEVIIPAGEVIYIFYSSYVNKENPIQFLYHNITSLEDNYIIDEDGIILNSPNWSAVVDENFFNQTLYITSSFFGEKFISKQRSKYIREIDKYCNIYTDGIINYYGFLETEYASVTEIQNLLVNGNNFITTNGWIGVPGTPTSSSIALSNIEIEKELYKTLRINFGSAGKVINTGLYDNRKATQSFTKGEKYIFATQYSSKDVSNVINGASISGTYYDSTDAEETLFTFKAFTGIKPDSLSNYTVFEGTCEKSLSYDELLKYDTRFYVFGAGEVELIDAKLFKELKGADNKLIVPDLESTINSIIRTKYHLFPCSLIDNISPQKIFSMDDIAFTAVCYEEDLKGLGFLPVYSDNYEKIRSITGSKTNRFNLIQELCESFECWAKFNIGHDARGKIIYHYDKVNTENAPTEGKTYYRKLSQDSDNFKDINFRIAANEEIYSYSLVNKANANVNPLITYYKKVNNEYEELLYNEGNFININPNPLTAPIWGFRSDLDYYTQNTFINGDYYEKVFEKTIAFKKFIGKENLVGFRYGINLKSIQRTINSDQVVTKMIVEPNTNEFAENGSCTIQKSILNPTGENVTYNFEYYIRHKLLDREALHNDLYGINGGLGLYVKLREWNNQTTSPIEELASISNTLNVLTSRRLTYSSIISESEELYEEAIAEIMTARNCTREVAETLQYSETLYDAFVNDCIIKRNEAVSSKNRYINILNNTLTLISGYNNAYAEITHKLNKISKKKQALNSEFFKKYSRFIQEGTWTSADYIDPEDYYLDSQMVLHTSASPKITYTINVIEISQVEGYEPYFFKIGDKTYMEDTEFFGWQSNGKPYQEEIIVSEVSYSLDDPSKNTIKVQNYKTQFEDLFQRITATTQSLQYHEGEYQRAANAINSDGSIKTSLLQNSLNNNSLILKNAKEESVYWDETGITISNFVNPNNIVRLVSGGIVLSSNGGRDWTTGITGEGINANVITTGRLDTNRIRIFGTNQPTFEWNSTGINAYAQTVSEDGESAGPVNYAQFVRYDQFGLYGYLGSEEGVNFNSITDVLDKASFSLTWKGLKIRLPDSGAENQVINVNDKFIVYGDGSIKATSGKFSGDITGSTGTFTGGLNIGNGAFVVTDKGELTATTGTFSGLIDGTAGAKLKGTLTGVDGGAIEGISLNIGSGAFAVDSSGNLTLDGEIKFSGQTYGNLANFTSTHGDGVGLTSLYSYGITQTSIRRCSIESPTITGNDIIVNGHFQTRNSSDSPTGYIGAAYGNNGIIDTAGVAMCASNANITYLSSEPYLIVTTTGVRMTCNNNSVYVTDDGVYVRANGVNQTLKQYILDVVGSGSGEE